MNREHVDAADGSRPGRPGLAEEVEHFLRRQGEHRRAAAAAAAFAGRLPGLTVAQRREVVRLYCADHLELDRESLARLAQHPRRRPQDRRGTDITTRRQHLRCRAVATLLLVFAVTIPVPLLIILTRTG